MKVTSSPYNITKYQACADRQSLVHSSAVSTGWRCPGLDLTFKFAASLAGTAFGARGPFRLFTDAVLLRRRMIHAGPNEPLLGASVCGSPSPRGAYECLDRNITSTAGTQRYLNYQTRRGGIKVGDEGARTQGGSGRSSFPNAPAAQGHKYAAPQLPRPRDRRRISNACSHVRAQPDTGGQAIWRDQSGHVRERGTEAAACYVRCMARI